MSASLNTSLLLDAIGLDGGRLDSRFEVNDSRVRDPLTGTHRRFNGNCCCWNLAFRHDVPGTQWVRGMFSEKASRNHFYRLDFERANWDTRPWGMVFVEHKNVLGLKVRAEVGNLFHSRDRSFSTAYVGRRDGPVDYTRDFSQSSGWVYRLRISGTF